MRFFIVFSMSFRTESPVFEVLNRYAFDIYLVQRIPMLLLVGRIRSNPLYLLLCALITVPLSLLW